MIGRSQIQIDSRQFLQGLATTDYMPDGGIGTSSYNLNPIGQPGVMRATGSAASGGDTLSGPILASCEDPRSGTSTTSQRIVLDDSGKLYGLGESILALRATLASSSGLSDSTTDMVAFQGDLYITKTTNIIKVTIPSTFTNAWTLDETWWTVTKGKGALTGLNTVHPMLVYENLLWIADSESLHNVTTGGTATEDVLSLNTNDRITALGIDPGTGLMLIGIATYSNNDANTSARFFIALYDGFSSKVRRRIPVDGLVTAFRSVGGTVFVGMANTIGVWNGSGVTFLRRLPQVGISSTSLPYKSRLSHFQNTLLVADGTDVLAYGDIANGKKAWYPFYRNQVNSNFVRSIVPTTITTTTGNSGSPLSHIIAVGDTSTSLRMLEPMDTSVVATGIFYTPKINFERPVNIRRVRVFTTGITTTAGIGGVGIVDEDNQTTTPTVSTFVVASGTKYRFDFDFNKQLQELQLKLTLGTQAFGIIRIVVYYDVVE